MLIDSMMAEAGPFVRALDTPYEKARAAITTARTVGKALAAFNKIRQLADERIAAMRDVPDELAQKRLEKARHGADEAEASARGAQRLFSQVAKGERSSATGRG
jgi:hypothetical protein